MNNDTTRVITGPKCRLSYFHGWEATSQKNGPKRYSTAVLIPKEDTATVQAILNAIDAAIAQGTRIFGDNVTRANLKLPLRDGDTERNDAAYRGCYYLNAKSQTPPEIVDMFIKPITIREEVYSGCYARVSLTFYPFSVNGNKGIAVGLDNIQKIKDGTPLDGRNSAAADFGGFETLGEVATDFLD